MAFRLWPRLSFLVIQLIPGNYEWRWNALNFAILSKGIAWSAHIISNSSVLSSSHNFIPKSCLQTFLTIGYMVNDIKAISLGPCGFLTFYCFLSRSVVDVCGTLTLASRAKGTNWFFLSSGGFCLPTKPPLVEFPFCYFNFICCWRLA